MTELNPPRVAAQFSSASIEPFFIFISPSPPRPRPSVAVLSGKLFLGDTSNPRVTQWVDSGLISTIGTAIDILSSGDISAGGNFSVLGGSVTGTGLEDDGQLRLAGGSINLSFLTIGAGGDLSGLGVVTNPIANSGIIDARVGKLDLGGGVTGGGQLQISAGANLEPGGPTAEGVTFEGPLAMLSLDYANSFDGTVAGMKNSDAILLANFAFSSHPSITSVSGTGAAGSTTNVTITDGSLTTTISLPNQYANEFAVTPSAYTLTSAHPGSASAGTLFNLASPVHS